eukprot:7230294-Alexandrium_andersonii.AAC.1
MPEARAQKAKVHTKEAGMMPCRYWSCKLSAKISAALSRLTWAGGASHSESLPGEGGSSKAPAEGSSQSWSGSGSLRRPAVEEEAMLGR